MARPSTNAKKIGNSSPRGAVSAPKAATGGGKISTGPVKQAGLSQKGK